MKPLVWVGSSREDVRAFPEAVRQEAGFELYQVQCGREPTSWKPMSMVGAGVKEIRLRERNQYRVLYVANLAEAVYVLHAFVKKTRRTSKADINLAKTRFKYLMTRLRAQS